MPDLFAEITRMSSEELKAYDLQEDAQRQRDNERIKLERKRGALERSLREKQTLLQEANAKAKKNKLSRSESVHGEELMSPGFEGPKKTASLSVTATGSPTLSIKQLFTARGASKAPRSPRTVWLRKGQTLQANDAHRCQQMLLQEQYNVTTPSKVQNGMRRNHSFTGDPSTARHKGDFKQYKNIMPKVKMGGVKGFKGLTCWRNVEQAKNIHRELTNEEWHDLSLDELSLRPEMLMIVDTDMTENVSTVLNRFKTLKIKHVVIDAYSHPKSGVQQLKMLILQLRRVRKVPPTDQDSGIFYVAKAQSPNIVIVLKSQPTRNFRRFLAQFPYVYFFVGDHRITTNPHFLRFLSYTKLMLRLKGQMDAAEVDESGQRTGLGLEANMVDALAMTQLRNTNVRLPSKFRMLNELTYRSNFTVLKYKILQNTLRNQNRGLQAHDYVLSTLYQSGSSIADTFSDILMAQAFHSGHGRDYVRVYSQLLGIPDGMASGAGSCVSRTSLTGLHITSDVLQAMFDHAGIAGLTNDSVQPGSAAKVSYDIACWYVIEVLRAVPIGLYRKQVIMTETEEEPYDMSLVVSTPPLRYTSVTLHDILYIILPQESDAGDGAKDQAHQGQGQGQQKPKQKPAQKQRPPAHSPVPAATRRRSSTASKWKSVFEAVTKQLSPTRTNPPRGGLHSSGSTGQTPPPPGATVARNLSASLDEESAPNRPFQPPAPRDSTRKAGSLANPPVFSTPPGTPTAKPKASSSSDLGRRASLPKY